MPPSAVPANHATSCRRVLVVDDDEGNATLLTRLLQNSGHEVRMAGDGPQALATANEYRPEVVFLDIGLPGMSGYEVARLLRDAAGDSKMMLVAVSGYDEDAHTEAPVKIFDHWLVKPVPFASVQKLISEH